jgi:serine/threonine protein kinase
MSNLNQNLSLSNNNNNKYTIQQHLEFPNININIFPINSSIKFPQFNSTTNNSLYISEGSYGRVSKIILNNDEYKGSYAVKESTEIRSGNKNIELLKLSLSDFKEIQFDLTISNYFRDFPIKPPCFMSFKELLIDDKGNHELLMPYFETDFDRFMELKRFDSLAFHIFMKNSNTFRTYSERKEKEDEIAAKLIKAFIFTLLYQLKIFKKLELCHFDIKSLNILINTVQENNNKYFIPCICDFGFARFHPDFSIFSNIIATLWYRPPEVVLIDPRQSISNMNRGFGYETDMWSLGCVFGEMLSPDHDKLFPVTDVDELHEKILGSISIQFETDDDNSLGNLKKQYEYYQKKEIERENLFGPSEFKNIKNRAGTTNRITLEAFDLLEKMLAFHPHRRITPTDAMNHSYFTNDTSFSEYLHPFVQKNNGVIIFN